MNMPTKDERVDAYIAKSADFAKPILIHLREIVHTACPEVKETIKWSFPNFEYKGILCNMASFKPHCSFGFWKGSLMQDPHKILTGENAMGHLGQIKSMEDLPSDDILITYIKEAARLNDEGVKVPSKNNSGEKKVLNVPDYFTIALKKNPPASKTFDNFSYTNRKEYVEWITEAKTEETRNKRMTTALEWLAEGKARHWKYGGK